MKRICALVAILWLPGCATILDGTNQKMTLNSNPDGADCMLERREDGNTQVIARVTTPETIKVRKTKNDITVTCELDGYHRSKEFVKSEIEGATWGNIVAGGGIGWAVDSASGSDNSYSRYVTVTMVPLSLPAPPEPVQIQEPDQTPSDGAPAE